MCSHRCLSTRATAVDHSQSAMSGRRSLSQEIHNWRFGLARAKSQVEALDEALAAANAAAAADIAEANARVEAAFTELRRTEGALPDFRHKPATAGDGRPAKEELMDGALSRIAAAVSERTPATNHVPHPTTSEAACRRVGHMVGLHGLHMDTQYPTCPCYR